MAAALSGNPGIAAGFALADDVSRSKAAPAIAGNPSSPESINAGGVPAPRSEHHGDRRDRRDKNSNFLERLF
ncbi:MAG: hypothetical protein ACREC0_00565 [Methylocella sp.]